MYLGLGFVRIMRLYLESNKLKLQFVGNTTGGAWANNIFLPQNSHEHSKNEPNREKQEKHRFNEVRQLPTFSRHNERDFINQSI